MKQRWMAILGCISAVALLVLLVRSMWWGVPDTPRPEQAVVGPKLNLREFQAVPHTDVFRAALTEVGTGYSSGYLTRNILFIEPGGQARWLLPDDQHALEEHTVLPLADQPGDQDPAPVASVFRAAPALHDGKVGDLYLCDPTGRRVVAIANDVLAVHGVALTPSGMALLYERPNGYVLATYEIETFKLVRQVTVAIPTLKQTGLTNG